MSRESSRLRVPNPRSAAVEVGINGLVIGKVKALSALSLDLYDVGKNGLSLARELGKNDDVLYMVKIQKWVTYDKVRNAREASAFAGRRIGCRLLHQGAGWAAATTHDSLLANLLGNVDGRGSVSRLAGQDTGEILELLGGSESAEGKEEDGVGEHIDGW